MLQTAFFKMSCLSWYGINSDFKDHEHFSVSKTKVSRLDSKTVFHLLLWSLHSHTQKNLQLSPTLALCLPIVQKIYVMYLMNFLEHAKCPNVPFMIKVTLVMELIKKYLVVKLFQLQTCRALCCFRFYQRNRVNTTFCYKCLTLFHLASILETIQPLCSCGPNMSKKIAETSSAHFCDQLDGLMP